MDTPNVNNLNGVPNFGFGLPPDGIVIAGVTDTQIYEETQSTDQSAQSNEGVPEGDASFGQQAGTPSQETQTSDSNSPQSSGT